MLLRNISTKELSTQLNNPKFVLLDIRPSAAYNGWKLKDEARGGHIRGAVSFPISWIKQLSSQELESLLASKGITSKNTIVVYGYKGDNCSTMANLLWDLGIRKVFIYEAGLQEWAADPGLPMDHFANYEKLVYPEWIEKLISGKKPENSPNKDYKLIEVSFKGFEEYKAGHIPGAYHFDLASIECAANLEYLLGYRIIKSFVGSRNYVQIDSCFIWPKYHGHNPSRKCLNVRRG